MACIPRSARILLLALSVHEWLAVEAARVRLGSCRARHPRRGVLVDGLCMPVHNCLHSLKDARVLSFPTFCGVWGFLPIMCCPEPKRPTKAMTFTTQTTASIRNDSCQTESGQRGTCMPLFDCQRLEKQKDQRRVYPPICNVKSRVPYACCPRNETLPLEPIQHDAPSRDSKVSQLLYQNGVLCGKRKPRRGHRLHVPIIPVVIGGRDAEAEAYPFAVAIFRDKVSVQNFRCGGALITKTVVLSAAHCFYGTLTDTEYFVRVGSVKISEESKGSSVGRKVTSVHIHPDYNDRQHNADVALLRLDRSAMSEQHWPPFVCLPNRAAEPSTEQAIVLGWGHNTFGGRLQTHLQEATVPLVTNDVCNKAYRSLNSYEREFPKGINEDFICAGNITAGGVDACQQDSGRPLLSKSLRNGGDIHEIIGIVSFGVGCGSADFPGAYARVATYRRWILNTMAEVLPDSEINLN